MELSYISGNENPKNFLCFKKQLSEPKNENTSILKCFLRFKR